MLIVISDLHLADETAGKHNIPAEAFRIFFQDIAGNTRRYKKLGREIKEIKIVFLGDIFDLLRTEAWFKDIPVEERPWGTKEKRIEDHAGKLLDEIISKNRATLDLLSGSLKEEFGLPVEPERIYIPGNHDRLCNKYPSLVNKVCSTLAITRPINRFEHTFQDVEYGVFARHGHEFDVFNYEGGSSYGYGDYMKVPVGDPITTELLARIPWQIMQHREVKSLPQTEQEALQRNFQEIENIRPFSATIEWLLYQVRTNRTIKNVIEESVDQVVQDFNRLDFVKKWYRHHDTWTTPIDKADQIQLFLFLLEKFRLFSAEGIMPLLERLDKLIAAGRTQEAAAQEYAHLDKRIRYIIYGHTHNPLQTPIRIVQDQSGSTVEHVYLNTGTWRERYFKTIEGHDFIKWKNMTYVVFYKNEERGTDFPAYETWTGTLKTG